MFLGVDGGGTKTAFCLLRRDGAVVASAQGPSTSTAAGRHDPLVHVLADGISTACRQAGTTPAELDYAFIGLPGYGEIRAAVPALDHAPFQVLQHHRYTCDNDMVCGWAGSLGGADGINVISGTGSMAYGRYAGRRARAGGWGELFGDEGSAHWIAVRALAAFAAMSDGRMPGSPLHRILREHLGVPDDLDVIEVIHRHWGGRRLEIASLSPIVVGAAAQGDPVARQILHDAAGELVSLVDACRRRLRFPADTAVPVSYSGGVFTADPVRALFAEKLRALDVAYDLRTPLYPPVLGAALYAAILSGHVVRVPHAGG